jgi:hypothetical protein
VEKKLRKTHVQKKENELSSTSAIILIVVLAVTVPRSCRADRSVDRHDWNR